MRKDFPLVVRIPHQLRREIDKTAKAEGLARSAWVRFILERNVGRRLITEETK
jgi:hypothetical protein